MTVRVWKTGVFLRVTRDASNSTRKLILWRRNTTEIGVASLIGHYYGLNFPAQVTTNQIHLRFRQFRYLLSLAGSGWGGGGESSSRRETSRWLLKLQGTLIFRVRHSPRGEAFFYRNHKHLNPLLRAATLASHPRDFSLPIGRVQQRSP